MKPKSARFAVVGMPVFAGVLMLAATLVLWQQLKSHERQVMHGMSALAASGVRTDLVEDVEARMLPQQLLARMWDVKRLPTRQEWETNARIYLKYHPDCMALEWVDATYRVRWALASNSDESEEGLDLTTDASRAALEAALNSRPDDAVVGPLFQTGSGTWARRMVTPVYRGDFFLGFVIGVYDDAKMFKDALDHHESLGYGIVVSENGRPIYQLGARDKHINGSDTSVPVDIRNVAWDLRVWPNSSDLIHLQSHLPQSVLLGGGIISLLLSLTIHFAQSSRRKSKSLARANGELENEIAERGRVEQQLRLSQEELRRAHDELEQRVQERTAELAEANAHLRTEIAERIHAEAVLRETSGRLLQIQEEERRTIARELHDSTAQNLVALIMNLEMARAGSGNGTAELLDSAIKLATNSAAEIRTVSLLLHPPVLDKLGLEAALGWYTEGFSTRSGIDVVLEVRGNLEGVPREVQLTVFRIVQEALTNVHRHSQSKVARIRIKRDNGCIGMEIADEGRGIPKETLKACTNGGVKLGVGIAGMRERMRQLGGKLTIGSSSRGTTITAVVPIDWSEQVRSGAASKMAV